MISSGEGWFFMAMIALKIASRWGVTFNPLETNMLIYSSFFMQI
jgi:hypothetical protein